MVNSDRITTYIGTYTRRESFVDGKGEGIYIYHLDPRSGELTYAATVTGAGTINPSFLTLGPDKRTLYAVNEITGGKGPYGTVSAFAIDPVTKHLSYLNQQSTRGLAPCYVALSLKGAIAWWPTMRPAAYAFCRSRKTGAWARQPISVQFSGSGPYPERQAGPHAHMVMLAPVSNPFLQLTWVRTG